MIAMIDTPQSLDQCAEELGCEVRQFFSPQTYRRAQQPEMRFGIDNGAFGKFDEPLFLRLMERERARRDLCDFLAVPDVVVKTRYGVIGDARRTLEVFDSWRRRPELAGWPLTLVCQNGQENLTLPWEYCSGVFIGGDDEWKQGPGAAAIIKAAKMLGKRVHVGRVNTPGLFEFFEDLGADSTDGTGLARYTHMRKAIWDAHNQPKLALETEALDDFAASRKLS